MEVLYYSHPSFLEHDTGAWHPERASRLEAAERGAMTSGVAIRRVVPPEIDLDVLALVHDRAYIDAIRRFCASGGGALDADTVASSRSWDAALRAVGAGVAAVEALGDADPETTAFLAVRPPGHHALKNRAMGFCLFNNAAVAAMKLMEEGNRVAIVDWDVHHGNGTQGLLANHPDLLYLSIHQHPFYPFEGEVSDTHIAKGTVVNAPIPAGTGGDVYRVLFERVMVPVLHQFDPDWILVSAGYDAHEDDPLAEIRLLAPDYGFMASRLRKVLEPHRIVVYLEGGYHLPAITSSVAATLRGLAGRFDEEDGESRISPPAAWQVVDQVAAETARYWNLP